MSEGDAGFPVPSASLATLDLSMASDKVFLALTHMK